METSKSSLSNQSLEAAGRSIGVNRPSSQLSSTGNFAQALIRDLGRAVTRRARQGRPASEVSEGPKSDGDRDNRRTRSERADEGSQRTATREARRKEHRARKVRREEEGPDSTGSESRRVLDESSATPGTSGLQQDRSVGEQQVQGERGAAQSQASAPVGVGEMPPTGAIFGATGANGAASGVTTSSGVSAVGRAPATGTSPVGTQQTFTTGEVQRARAAKSAPAPTAGPSASDLERAENVLNQVRLRIRPAMRQANIDLNPAELGRISIRLKVDDGGVNALLRAERPETLAVLERHLPELRAMLEQSGFESAEIDIGLATQGDAGGTLGDQQTAEGDAARSRTAGHSTESDTEHEEVDVVALARALSPEGVDTWA